MKTLRRTIRGQALVEFALIIPIFLLILIAAFDVGRGVFAYNSITNAAREGTRLGIVNQTTASIEARANAQASIADKSASAVDVEFLKANADGTPSADDCTSLQIGCFVQVTYTTNIRPITPIISNVIWPSGIDVTATSVEAIEYVCPNSTVAAGSCPKQP